MTARRKILIAGLAIIVVSNAIALAGVAYNRSSQLALVELSERELPMPYRYGMHKENSGLGLSLNCRLETYAYDNSYGNRNCTGNPPWLDVAKLKDLGFELPARAENNNGAYRQAKTLAQEVYLVLEFDGAAYRRVLADKLAKLGQEQDLLSKNPGIEEFEKRVKSARERVTNEQLRNSRLFAIDAGLDRAALRQKYPQSNQFFFVRALVKANHYRNNKKQKSAGTIASLHIDTINIALEHRALFNSLETTKTYAISGDRPPRYQVRLAFGKRDEPWVSAVKKFEEN